MENRWCNVCGASYAPRPQSPRQAYCPRPECQRARKRLWQQTKRQSDPDYLDNQVDAQRAWAQRNPGYWRRYRDAHPAYVARNRSQQKARNQRDVAPPVANMDVWPLGMPPPPGLYELVLLDRNFVATADVWRVQLSVPQPLP